MPSITLSSALAGCANCQMLQFCSCTGVWCYNYNPYATNRIAATFSSGPTFYSAIKIMKGAVPLSFSELTTVDSRSADLLINFTASNLFINKSTLTTNPVILTSLPTTASASGTATWFWIAQQANISTGAVCNTQYNRCWGTVGLQGSGADLEINDTNIVLNNVYNIINLRIGIPQTYNY